MKKRLYLVLGMAVLAGLSSGTRSGAYAANTNLFISAEDMLFDNGFAGPMVVQVMVFDTDINNTDEIEGEPDVTVNGQILRMVQAVDGNWYGYLAMVDQVRAADKTVGLSGHGLDFGILSSTADVSALGVEFSGAVEIAAPVPASGIPIPETSNVLRQAPSINTHPEIFPGQIGLDPDAWPVIQLFSPGPAPGDIVTNIIDGKPVIEVVESWDPVIVQYNKGGGVQTATLSYNELPPAQITTDKAQYVPGDDVLLAVLDPQLNIDPTDRDSWTFHVTGPVATFYQAFNADGIPSATGTSGLVDLVPHLDDLGIVNRGVLSMVLGEGIELVTNDHQSHENNVTKGVSNGERFDQIVTLVETDASSGMFVSFDSNGQSILRIAHDAKPGRVGEITYNGQTIPIIVIPEISSFSALIVAGLLGWNRRSYGSAGKRCL